MFLNQSYILERYQITDIRQAWKTNTLNDFACNRINRMRKSRFVLSNRKVTSNELVQTGFLEVPPLMLQVSDCD